MKTVILAVAVIAVAAIALSPSRAHADDEPGLSDGGSICSSTDGGSYAVCDLGVAGCRSLGIRCEGAQSSRYKLCPTSTCAPSAINQLLDYDRTFDIPVNCVAGGTAKRYMGLHTDDAGVPFCKVQVAR